MVIYFTIQLSFFVIVNALPLFAEEARNQILSEEEGAVKT